MRFLYSHGKSADGFVRAVLVSRVEITAGRSASLVQARPVACVEMCPVEDHARWRARAICNEKQAENEDKYLKLWRVNHVLSSFLLVD